MAVALSWNSGEVLCNAWCLIYAQETVATNLSLTAYYERDRVSSRFPGQRRDSGEEGQHWGGCGWSQWTALSPPHCRPQTPAQPAMHTCLPSLQERAPSQPAQAASILGQILAARSVEIRQPALQPQLGWRPCQCPSSSPPPTSFLEQLLICPGCPKCCTRALGVWKRKPVSVGFTLHHSRICVT